jgi:hypothetical protein
MSNNKVFSKKWYYHWTRCLINVFIFAAALNCFFQWLAYAHHYDLAGFVFSLALGFWLYYYSSSSKNASNISRHLSTSLGTLAVWLVLFPIIMKVFGYNY